MAFHNDQHRVEECLRDAESMAHRLYESVSIFGYGILELRDGDGAIKQLEPFTNIVTNQGDLYYAGKAVVGVSPAALTAPTVMNGMKLGRGTVAPVKTGPTGMNILTGDYVTTSNVAFDSGPTLSAISAGLGVVAAYHSLWAAGVGTDTAIAEAALVNDSGTNAFSTAANTYARTTGFTPVNKGALDTLAITWNHTFKGS